MVTRLPGWFWLLVMVPPICGMDSCKSSTGDAERIVPGKVIRTLGAEGPLRLSVMEYRQGPARGQIWLATVETGRVDLSLHAAPGKARPLTGLLDPIGPGVDYVAINGGFYDDNGPLGLVIADGQRHKALRRDGGSGVFLVAPGGADIVHRDRYAPLEKPKLALQSIDRLVANGRVLVRKRPDMPLDARSAVAVDGWGTVYFLLIFDQQAIASAGGGKVRLGRRSTETGTSLYSLAEFMARPFSEGGLQLKHALNLDGGFSSAIQARIGGVETGVIAYLATINALVATRPRRGAHK